MNFKHLHSIKKQVKTRVGQNGQRSIIPGVLCDYVDTQANVRRRVLGSWSCSLTFLCFCLNQEASATSSGCAHSDCFARLPP